MASKKLAEQAANNTREQFANSPDLAREIIGAVMDALTARTAMSKQALESAQLPADMKCVLLGQALGRGQSKVVWRRGSCATVGAPDQMEKS